MAMRKALAARGLGSIALRAEAPEQHAARPAQAQRHDGVAAGRELLDEVHGPRGAAWGVEMSGD